MSRWTRRFPEEKKRILKEKRDRERERKQKMDLSLHDSRKFSELIVNGEIPMLCSKCRNTTYSKNYELVKGKILRNPLVRDNTPVVRGKCVCCGNDIQTILDLGMGSAMIMLNLDKLKIEGRLVDKR